MFGFIVRRLISAALVVILTSMAVFLLFFVGLGDTPARQACDRAFPNGKCAALNKLPGYIHNMELDKSVVTNYGEFVKGIFKGREISAGGEKRYDCSAPCLGISIGNGYAEVTQELKQKYPATLTLAIGGAAIYLVVGVALGVIAARKRGRPTDRLMMGATLVVSSVPYYLLALLAWIYFTQKHDWFPATGYFPITHNPFDTIKGMLLPWLVIGLTSATQYARFSRGQMVETLGEDYIRTASAKGLGQGKVLFKHALRAAIVPVITIFGLDFAALLAGTIFTEKIFDIDGIGNFGLRALGNPIDFSVISATVLVAAVLVVTANVVVDILYTFLDPRVSIS